MKARLLGIACSRRRGRDPRQRNGAGDGTDTHRRQLRPAK
jgi:hypothetical protein